MYTCMISDIPNLNDIHSTQFVNQINNVSTLRYMYDECDFARFFFPHKYYFDCNHFNVSICGLCVVN